MEGKSQKKVSQQKCHTVLSERRPQIYSIIITPVCKISSFELKREAFHLAEVTENN
jgi:hypothetical protein